MRATDDLATNEPGPATQRILVVDDGEDARTSMRDVLKLAIGIEVDTAANGSEALKLLSERPYSIVVTDLRMPKTSGMQLIDGVQEKKLPVTVIVTTGHGSIADAVQAMRHGAYDFLTKPVDPQHLTLLVQRALGERALRDEVTALRGRLKQEFSFGNVLSKNPRMIDIFDLIGQVADSNSTVLIYGETGTGKEMIARAIHQASPTRCQGPLVAVNCAALPETLLESELFGHEKGSFTGASTQRKGRFEQAHGGTLFLDEVGDVPMTMQVKLLRVLQERRIERVGGGEPINIDVRLVAATNRPLPKMVDEGKFREDLYYRLNVIKIDLPPLRDRADDIPLLAAHFTQKYARTGKDPAEISPEAMDLLLAYHWPGNVRQLENAIERASVTAREGVIRPENLPDDITSRKMATTGYEPDLDRPLAEQVAAITANIEEKYLRAALKKTRGHVGKCAELSGLSRRSITDKLNQYQIDKAEFKDGSTDEE